MSKKERSSLEVQSERAVLAAVRLPGDHFDAANPFGELRALAEQAGAVVVGELSQNLQRPVTGTYMGTGKIEELKALCETLNAATVIFDHDLSPKQISSIEQAIGRKVVDRSELILDIFAGRATTHEAKLQVELAQLEYTYPRLRAMWDHLERIVGGGGVAGIGTRGPGEQQLEIDRRLVQKRRLALERQLHDIQARKRREVASRNAEHFTIGLVGYTNAGKSTLFNTLTSGGAYADDRLFATLMTRTRQWDLGDSVRVMLSDTVGFVRDLPHNLIASFKATLEEATHADVLLIVLDVSDPAVEMHLNTVTTTLDELFEELEEELADSPDEHDRRWERPRRILLLNKADRLKDNADLLVWLRKHPDAIPLCALPASPGMPIPLGQAELADRIRGMARGEVRDVVVTLPTRDAKFIQRIEAQGIVRDREYHDDRVVIHVRIGLRQLALCKAAGSRLTVADEHGEPISLNFGPAPKPKPTPGLPGRPGWSKAASTDQS
ncbi:MAG: GTPase HflX [Phycisphaerales bacterium]